MSDMRDEFEKWFSDYMEVDSSILKRTRYTDEDSDFGYSGLESEGMTAEADSLASMALQAWQAARAQTGQGAEAEGFDFDGWYDKHQSLFRDGAGKSDLRAAYKQGYRDSQPQPAVPEGWLVRRVDDRITVQHPDIGGYCASKDGEDQSAIAPVILYHLASALLSTPATPQADGWVRCDDRLPEPRRASRKAPNGILAKFSNGRISHFREVTETLVTNMKNGQRQVLKFETPKPPRIVEWLDLDSPQPPAGREGA